MLIGHHVRAYNSDRKGKNHSRGTMLNEYSTHGVQAKRYGGEGGLMIP